MENKECFKNDFPRIMEISRVLDEANGIKSIFFREKIECKPGQFIMVWLPGCDEKPMAVSYHTKHEFAFTFQILGNFTNAIAKLKAGDKLGVRGPYGNSFSQKANCCIVAGGVGMASVSTLIDSIKNPVVIQGARSKEFMIYQKRYKSNKFNLTTDDGSFGKKGFTTEVLDELLSNNKKIKIVYTCGPEVMMKKVLEVCNKHKVTCEASLERYMSCGFGVCGKCTINDELVCVDGPIFNTKQLLKMDELGRSARLKSGKKITLGEYHSTHSQ